MLKNNDNVFLFTIMRDVKKHLTVSETKDNVQICCDEKLQFNVHQIDIWKYRPVFLFSNLGGVNKHLLHFYVNLTCLEYISNKAMRGDQDEWCMLVYVQVSSSGVQFVCVCATVIKYLSACGKIASSWKSYIVFKIAVLQWSYWKSGVLNFVSG